MTRVALGIDLATASARCVALDTSDGTVLASAAADLPPPVRDGSGSSTQQPDYADVAFEVVGRVCAQLADRAHDVGALSVSGTSGTVVPCSSAGVPVGLARLYDDSTGSGLPGAEGASMLGRAASLSAHHSAEQYASTADVVASALVGHKIPGDTSHWLKAGIDPMARVWPDEAVQALGLDPQTLPDLVHPGDVLGTVAADVASPLGLPAGVLVVAGMTDGCTAQIATGAVHPGDTVGVLGTTLVLKAVGDSRVATPDGVVYSHLAPDGRWWAGGASNTGTGALRAQFPLVNLRSMDAAVADTVASVVSYPLSGVGERFPIADPHLRTLTSRAPADELDAYRAVLEGVAFVERLGLQRLADLGVGLRRHVLAGGASASDVWNRIRATVLAPLVPVSKTARAGSAIGAAVLAAHAMDSRDFGTTVNRLTPLPTPVEPIAPQGHSLEQSYERFLDLVADATVTAEPEGAPHHV